MSVQFEAPSNMGRGVEELKVVKVDVDCDCVGELAFPDNIHLGRSALTTIT